MIGFRAFLLTQERTSSMAGAIPRRRLRKLYLGVAIARRPVDPHGRGVVVNIREKPARNIHLGCVFISGSGLGVEL